MPSRPRGDGSTLIFLPLLENRNRQTNEGDKPDLKELINATEERGEARTIDCIDQISAIDRERKTNTQRKIHIMT